jgi:hypothetical protein
MGYNNKVTRTGLLTKTGSCLALDKSRLYLIITLYYKGVKRTEIITFLYFFIRMLS